MRPGRGAAVFAPDEDAFFPSLLCHSSRGPRRRAQRARRDVRGATADAMPALEQVRELGRVAPRARGGHGEPAPGRERAARGSRIGRGGGGGAHRARDATRRARRARRGGKTGKHALDDPPHRHAQALAALVVGRGTARRVAWVARHAKWRHPRRTAEGIDNNSVSPFVAGPAEKPAQRKGIFQNGCRTRTPQWGALARCRASTRGHVKSQGDLVREGASFAVGRARDSLERFIVVGSSRTD